MSSHQTRLLWTHRYSHNFLEKHLFTSNFTTLFVFLHYSVTLLWNIASFTWVNSLNEGQTFFPEMLQMFSFYWSETSCFYTSFVVILFSTCWVWGNIEINRYRNQWKHSWKSFIFHRKHQLDEFMNYSWALRIWCIKMEMQRFNLWPQSFPASANVIWEMPD